MGAYGNYFTGFQTIEPVNGKCYKVVDKKLEEILEFVGKKKFKKTKLYELFGVERISKLLEMGELIMSGEYVKKSNIDDDIDIEKACNEEMIENV